MNRSATQAQSGSRSRRGAEVCVGIHPMLFAPFDGEGQLSRAIAETMVDAAILAGADGISILGELTEASRLSHGERRSLLEWVAERMAGRARLCVSIEAGDVAAYLDMVRASHAVGAHWLMLQPPPVPGLAGRELSQFFERAAGETDLPVCIRNAPKALGLGLTVEEIVELARKCANLVAVKVEADPVAVATLVKALDGALAVVNGRGALEMTDCLRAGAVGIMPGLETIDVTCAVFQDVVAGRTTAAEARFRTIAPLFTFLSASSAHRLLYGKLLLAFRLGLDALPPRPPYNPAHEFGVALVRRWADELGPLPPAGTSAQPRKATGA